MSTMLRRRGVNTQSAAPAPQAPKPANSPRLRLRVADNAAARAAQANNARAELDEHLQLIAKLDTELDNLMAALADQHKIVEDIMRRNKLSEHCDGAYKATIVEVFSRQSTVIDPKRFKASVADKDFWDCVTIAVGKAEEVLGKKELGRISDITPGKSQGYQFKLKKVDAKKVG